MKILHETEQKDGYLNIVFQNRMQESPLSREDRALVRELVSGVAKYRLSLDHAIRSFSGIRLKKISPYIMQILRLGMYQIYFMDKIPHPAAVNESVKLAKKYGHKASAGFVNAILHRATAEPIPCPKRDGDLTEYLSVHYSHPKELTAWYLETFGEERAEALLAANNARPPLSVRVNQCKTSREALREALREEGISAEDSPLTDCGLLLSGGNPERLAAYRSGLFSIQGQASQLAALALAPREGDTVLDLCAAPGGKTAHLAELMGNRGRILASDLYEHRLSVVRENAERLGLAIIETQALDATAEKAEYIGIADKILLDVPCSGLGILRRKPEIRYKEKLTDFRELCEIQKKMLKTSAKYLKIEGEMVYSTCTIDPAENEEQIRAFLSEHPEFSLVSAESPHMCAEIRALAKSGMFTLDPAVHGCDGFFICKLKRRS